MGFTHPPPIQADFLEFKRGANDRITGAVVSSAWLQWFADFREGVEVGLSLTQLQTELSSLSEENVDSVGAAIFGDDYKGAWIARSHNVGNVRSFERRYYRCKAARTSANVVTPDSDAAGWELIGSAADLAALGDDNINAIGGASFGADYKGEWAAGIYPVNSVAYYSGFFYKCSVARNASHTSNPSVDTGSWSITSTDTRSNVSQAVQNAIDATASIEYGSDYQGTWSAGAYAVGNVVYHGGLFYECDVARTSGNTSNPATDTASWSPKASAEGGITKAVQNAIDAQAAINFGALYRGAWKVGSYAVGDIIYYGGLFYECVTPRNSTHTQNPVSDSSSWSAKTIIFSITGDVNVDLTSVNNAIQKSIDAQGTANFGAKYKDSWSPGIYAVGDVSYHDGAFYTCTVARVSANTSNPSTDTNSWSVEVSESGGLGEAVQGAIDAAATIQFGTDYQGEWEAGTFSVGQIAYHSGKFYECGTARVAANMSNPATDTASWSLIPSRRQVERNNLGYATFGTEYKEAWAPGVYAVGNVAFHAGRFYQCSTARSSVNTSDPATDSSSWDVVGSVIDVDLSGIESTLSALETDVGGVSAGITGLETGVAVVNTAVGEARQAQIDAAARLAFGADYQGAWAAGIYAVGNVAFHAGQFYECDTARTAANTQNPAINTTAWSPIRSRRQIEIDNLGYANFGADYKGAWAVGSHSVDDVVSYGGRFYKCAVSRNSSHTGNPASDNSSWDVAGGAVPVDLSGIETGITGLETDVAGVGTMVSTLGTDISTARQAQIDAAATIAYGSDYKGAWAAGDYAVGNVAFHAGQFYECDAARTSVNTSNPATDTASWSVIQSLKQDQSGITQAVQKAINSQGTINFGSNYKGVWESRTYAVGNVVYHGGLFYEVDVALASASFPVLKRFSIPTTWGGGESVATLRARAVAANEDTAFSPPDPITSNVVPPVADNYMLRWRFLIRSMSRWNRITLSLPNGVDDWMHVYLFQSDVAGKLDGSEISSVKKESYAGSSYTGNTDFDESNWGSPAADGYYYAMMEAYFGEKTGAEMARWEIGYRIGVAVTDPETVNAPGGIQNIEAIGGYENPADDTAWAVKTVDVPNFDISGVSAEVQKAINAQATAAYGAGYKGTWSAGIYAAENVVYHSGAFYTCDVARTAADTDDPSVDTASWTIKVAVVGGLSQAVQNAIDSQAKISFGENYQGAWSVGTYAVENVVFYSGAFFECSVARNAGHTSNPASDTTGWKGKESVGEGVTRAINNTVDALGAATFGDDYTGEWEAGAHAVGDVVSFNIRFYECNTARNSGHTNNPSVDTGAWHLVGSAVTIRANLQDSIDALGAATYGNNYKGLWAAGDYTVDDYASYGGRFYRCKVSRTGSNTSDPSGDNTGWEAVGSSFTLQGDISTAKQENIDAAAQIVFGDDYKGKWAVGNFAVGDVAYDEVTEKFYECDTARVSANTNRPSVDTTSWSSLSPIRKGGVYAARDRAVANLPSSGADGDLVWVVGGKRFSAWDGGLAVPGAETGPTGLTVKANGDIVIVGFTTDKVYTYSNGAWDSGFAIPSEASGPQGLAVKANGEILLLGANRGKVYTYSNGSWDSGFATPSGETSPKGLAVKANGDILLTGNTTDKVYTYSNGSWDSGFATPDSNPQGLAVKANGDILLLGDTLNKVFTYSNGAWDGGIPIPSGESSPRGVAVNANGDILLLGGSGRRIYTSNLLRVLDRYVRISDEWELTAVQAFE